VLLAPSLSGPCIYSCTTLLNKGLPRGRKSHPDGTYTSTLSSVQKFDSLNYDTQKIHGIWRFHSTDVEDSGLLGSCVKEHSYWPLTMLQLETQISATACNTPDDENPNMKVQFRQWNPHLMFHDSMFILFMVQILSCQMDWIKCSFFSLVFKSTLGQKYLFL